MNTGNGNPTMRLSLGPLSVLISLAILNTSPALGMPLQCPQFCYCIDNFVTCSEFSYLDLSTIPHTTETLVLTKGEVEEIPPAFLATAPNLRILELISVQVRVLRGSAFIGLNKLELLTITGSSFDIVEPDSFSGISEVDKFEITDSKFGRLGKHAFGHISNITDFNIWSNSFDDFSSEAFMGLKNVKRFQLIRNNITRIGHGFFRDATAISAATVYQNTIEKIEPASFERLAQITERMVFRDNMFRCTCELAWVLVMPDLDEYMESNECSFSKMGQAVQPENTFLLSDINRGVLCPMWGRDETDEIVRSGIEGVVSEDIDLHQHAIVPYVDEKFDEKFDMMDQADDIAVEEALEFAEQFKNFGWENGFEIDDSFVEIDDSFKQPETYDTDTSSEDPDEVLQESTSPEPKHTEQITTTEGQAHADDKESSYGQESVISDDETEIEEKRERNNDYTTSTQNLPKDEDSRYTQGQDSFVTGEAEADSTWYTGKGTESTEETQAEESTGDAEDLQIFWNEHILYASPASQVTEQQSTLVSQAGHDDRNTHKIDNSINTVTDRTSTAKTTFTTGSPGSYEEDDKEPETISPVIENFDLDISRIFDEDIYVSEPSQPAGEAASMGKTVATAATPSMEDSATTASVFTQPDHSVTGAVGRQGNGRTRVVHEPAFRPDRWSHRPHMQPERLHSDVEKDSAPTSGSIPACLLLIMSLAACLLGKH